MSDFNSGREPCQLCKIVSRPADPLTLFQGKFSILALDKRPFNPGQILVVYKEHCNFQSLERETSDDFLRLQRSAFKLIEKVIAPQGFNIHFGLGSAQEDGWKDHLFSTVIPRFSGDVNFVAAGGKIKVTGIDLVSLANDLKAAVQETDFK